ncbi:uncharacterized protein EI90DRAFT_3123950 [Cantharellus anzutake]|uniref:uncharacterized protein n=1 Tax=Cantharellus anzutake TaxID=1750568 RepID=UPI0019071821|nr:uncharacterized protein EI90DRAFT_3123950 [Cantharellus anzutake]KAF8330732.1 hypothetical protein EI90DRAFT_3123950 [Cantharellus anzutake]
MSEQHLFFGSFCAFDKELAVGDPKSLEDIYKSHLENTHAQIWLATLQHSFTFASRWLNNVLIVQSLLHHCSDHIDTEKEDDMFKAYAVIAIALIAMGEDISAEMSVSYPYQLRLTSDLLRHCSGSPPVRPLPHLCHILQYTSGPPPPPISGTFSGTLYPHHRSLLIFLSTQHYYEPPRTSTNPTKVFPLSNSCR